MKLGGFNVVQLIITGIGIDPRDPAAEGGVRLLSRSSFAHDTLLEI